MRFLVVGNPEGRRLRLFKEALAVAPSSSINILSWEQLLKQLSRRPDAECLTDTDTLRSHFSSNAVVRIESPGENFTVDKLLLEIGIAPAQSDGCPFLTAEEIDRLEFDRGRILYPRQWYLGFRSALQQLALLVDSRSCNVMNHPADIAVLFDKVECQNRLERTGIPVPRSCGPVTSYDDLMSRMDEAGLDRVFVKLAHGSSASGVVAFHRSGNRQRAITTVELSNNDGTPRLYNSLKIRMYTDRKNISTIIDMLCRERVQVEEWLPKARLDRQEFDIRILVVAGKARQVVVRQNDVPITNLHLNSRRGDVEALRTALGDRWFEIEHTCAQAMSLFPRSLYAGIDIAISPDFRQHAVLELNAFGDLLPGILDDGLSTYAAEVAALRNISR